MKNSENAEEGLKTHLLGFEILFHLKLNDWLGCERSRREPVLSNAGSLLIVHVAECYASL